jgi:hypothetical protein
MLAKHPVPEGFDVNTVRIDLRDVGLPTIDLLIEGMTHLPYKQVAPIIQQIQQDVGRVIQERVHEFSAAQQQLKPMTGDEHLLGDLPVFADAEEQA